LRLIFEKAGIFAGVVVIAFLMVGGAFGLVRFVQQQRGQTAYLLSISARLGRLETNLSSAASHVDGQLRSLREEIADTKHRLGGPECLAIPKLPARIERPGHYCLRNGQEYSLLRHEDGITVAADNVTIDLMGATLRGHGKDDTISAGIYSPGYRNLVVSNGTISGFMFGVRYDEAPPGRNGGGTLVFRDLIIRDSGFRGIYVDFGAAAATQGSVAITDSVIDRVGGTAAFSDAYAMGIELKNTKSCRIFGNRIVDVLPVGLGEGVGISFTRANGGCVAEQNYLLNSTRPEWGRTIGIWPGPREDDPSFMFRNNVVYNYTYPFMHNSKVTVFTGNLFHSPGCSPRNVRYFDAYAALNQWVNEADVCVGHPDRFRLAAEAGDARAQFRMGTIYWEGVGAPGSSEEAWRWRGLAARNGLPAAKEWIASQLAARQRDPSWFVPPDYLQ
jgi:hypothetical protein